jgi:CheY-like chemotaxis protein
MSHDIRTPLNAVIGLTNLALYSPEDSKKVTECLQKIANSSQLLLGLINDVLDMSKIESGKMQLAETEFELGEWLSGVVTVTQSQTGVRSQHFDVNVWNITHELLCGDTVRLGQVLTNVLGNAVKFTPKDGEIYLDITEVPSQDPSFASFVFRVSDTGVGMSREYMGRIFEMFSRDQNSYKQGIQGTGLGMSIAQGIVSTMQGDIHVESREGEGSCFTVTLNFRIQGKEQERAGGMRDCIRDDDMDCSSLAGRRILLVEDNALNMEIAKAILCEHGLEVDGAENGQEAYERFTSSAPGTYEAVLMDLQMPVMDGCTAARMIRASSHPQARTIPIIALTANAFAEDVAKALTSGMNYHIAKPIDFHQLFHALKQFMTTS